MPAGAGTEIESAVEPLARPSGKQSLLDVYGLRSFANSVARQDPQTGAKRKLRKSYKNHIADLPGKHPVPGPGETAWTLLDAAMRPAPSCAQEAIKSLEFPPEMLGKLKFQKSVAPLPSFDPKLLAAPGLQGDSHAANADSPAGSPASRVNSPVPDEHKLEKRKRKEAIAAEKRRKTGSA